MKVVIEVTETEWFHMSVEKFVFIADYIVYKDRLN